MTEHVMVLTFALRRNTMIDTIVLKVNRVPARIEPGVWFTDTKEHQGVVFLLSTSITRNTRQFMEVILRSHTLTTL
jgi:hypothetical protein